MKQQLKELLLRQNLFFQTRQYGIYKRLTDEDIEQIVTMIINEVDKCS